MMFDDDESIDESYHQLTTIHVHRKKNIANHAKLLTSTPSERQHFSYRDYQHPATSKNKIKKVTMIDACQPLPLERPFSVPVTRMSGRRPKNFRVRVYRNGDDSICAYCASCTMDTILNEATRKLQLIRPAQRLFDSNGCEIFRSEDIQRDMEYYVSDGEDFISPLEAIEAKIQYRLQSIWTLDGIKSSYIRIKRRRRRRQQGSTYIKNLKPPYYDLTVPTYHDKGIQAGEKISFDDKDTQTTTKCENKCIQTDRKISLGDKNTQTTTTKCENKDMQTDGKISIDNKDTQTTITKYENKDMQTDEKISIDNKDTQTTTKCEDKDIQTDGKISLDNKDTQTTTKCYNREIQTDIKIPPASPEIPPQSGEILPRPGEIPPRPREIPPRPGEISPRPGEISPRPGEIPPRPREIPPRPREIPPRPGEILPRPGEIPRRPGEIPPGVETESDVEQLSEPPSRRSSETRRFSAKYTQTGYIPTEYTRTGYAQTESNRVKWDHTNLTEPIYSRPSPKTNFRVKVYRNGERGRYAYCKSCSMDIILSAATDKLQMAIPARRLFDANGVEIFHSKDIHRDVEYFVSSGANFIPPGSSQIGRSQTNLVLRGSNETESNQMKLVRQETNQKQSDYTGSSQMVPVRSSIETIYRRSSPSTNFRVKVYRNGERGRYAYCKSCSMDIILSAATDKLGMPLPARRLFDANGLEIFHSKDIHRDAEYFVSSGENFKKPLK